MQPNLFAPEKWASLRPLRPRQSAAIDAIRQAVREGHKRIVVQAPTGFGKTLLSAHLIESSIQKGKRPLFTCPAITLVNQTLAAFEAEGITDIGVIQAQHERTDWTAQVQIASVQTLIRRSLPEVDFVIVDECFPAGTMVSTPSGERPIETMREGDEILSSVGIDCVVSCFSKPHNKFTRMRFSDGAVIRCTPDHPIFTDRGWVKARDMEVGSRVFSQEAMRELWRGVWPPVSGEWGSCRLAGIGISLQQAQILWTILREEVRKSDASGGDEGSCISGPPQDQSSPGEAWWERDAIAIIAARHFRDASADSAGLEGGACGKDASQAAGISALLQAGSSQPEDDDRHRARWGKSRFSNAERAGREEGRLAPLARLEGIEIEEFRREELVYNLRVRQHPSYFANGILVHNCHNQFAKLNETLDGDAWKGKIVIGLSATPWSKGMGLRWTKLVIAATVSELIEDGHLSPFLIYAPAVDADFSKLRVKAGEFTDESAAAVMGERTVVADVVKTWQEKAENRPTFLFAVDCAHARALQSEFERANISCGYIDANSDDDSRRTTFARFRDRRDRIIASVGCLTTGVDEDVRCIIDAAPTKSEIRHVQKIGRGLRTAPGKEMLIILDHAGNTLRLGAVTDIYHDHLDARKPGERGEAFEDDPEPPKPRKCRQCHMIVPRGHRKCPNCGAEMGRPSDVETKDGQLVEFDGRKKKGKDRVYTMAEKQLWYSSFLKLANDRGRAPGWAAHRYKEKFGVWPNGLGKTPSVEVHPEVAAYDKHLRIRYAKAKEKEHNASTPAEASAVPW